MSDIKKEGEYMTLYERHVAPHYYEQTPAQRSEFDKGKLVPVRRAEDAAAYLRKQQQQAAAAPRTAAAPQPQPQPETAAQRAGREAQAAQAEYVIAVVNLCRSTVSRTRWSGSTWKRA